MLMQGKSGMVFGAANQRSIAWGIGNAFLENGARVGFGYQNERLRSNLENLVEGHPNASLYECDVCDDDSVHTTMKNVEKVLGRIDFLVHSLAYADKKNLESSFIDTSREDYLKSLEISSYSLVHLCREFMPIMNEGVSIVALTYLGSVQTVANYNIMGVAKAALESNVRYLARDVGEKKKGRVNAISAGPIQTLAARGIRDFSVLHKIHPRIAPLGRPTTQEDVAGAALFLCSHLGSGMTSEILFVDGGFRNVAVGPKEAYNF